MYLSRFYNRFILLFFAFIIASVLFTEIVSADLTTPALSASIANEPTVILLGGERIVHAAPAAADFNGDGDKEIVVGTYDGMLHIMAYEGNTWSVVWSRQTAQDLNSVLPPQDRQNTGRIDSAPSISDLDNDGDLEIVVSLGGAPDGFNPANNRNGGIIVYQRSNGWNFAVMPGWPFAMPDTMGKGTGGGTPDGIRDGIFTSPALGDVDGDGDLEIFTQAFDRRIRGWHHTGEEIAGWPIERASGDPILRGGWSTPAIGDIDNDGLDEVVLGNNSPPWGGEGSPSPDYSKATLWALNGDSSLVPGFPVVTGQQVHSSPALGDIDGDGDLEIVVGTGVGIPGSGGFKVHAWHGNGSIVAGWPRPTQGNTPASPALADLNEDGVLDVVIGCGAESEQNCSYLYAWQGNGSSLPGFPMQPRDANPWPGQQNPHAQPYPPIVADIDDDGSLEILMVMSGSAGVTVVEHNGNSNDYSRYQEGEHDSLLAPPLVDDLDNDGLLETVAAGAKNQQAAVHIWQEVGENELKLSWPMFHRNITRNGRYVHPRLIAPAEIHLMHPAKGVPTVQGQITIRNAGDDAFQWQITKAPKGVHFDHTSGTLTNQTRLPFTIDARGHAQNTWQNLGEVTISGTIDSEPVLDSPQNASLWLYVGDASSVYIPVIKS